MHVKQTEESGPRLAQDRLSASIAVAGGEPFTLTTAQVDGLIVALAMLRVEMVPPCDWRIVTATGKPYPTGGFSRTAQ